MKTIALTDGSRTDLRSLGCVVIARLFARLPRHVAVLVAPAVKQALPLVIARPLRQREISRRLPTVPTASASSTAGLYHGQHSEQGSSTYFADAVDDTALGHSDSKAALAAGASGRPLGRGE